MRHIAKQAVRPPSLEAFVVAQLPVGLNHDYRNGFTGQTQLRAELIAEQFGLCAYTGVAIDERIGVIQTANPKIRLQAHIEHLKPQSVCREEVEDGGHKIGHVLGDDMDHHNMVAALEVNGSRNEQFGASARKDFVLAVLPTHAGCEARFAYGDTGDVQGLDADAAATVTLLVLNHLTLAGWRSAAIEAFLDPLIVTTKEDMEVVIAAMDIPIGGKLPEFSFCIKSVANQLFTA